MVLSVAIQHHPSRAYLIPSLLAALPGAEVIEDPDPEGPRSAWRTYREAIRRTPDTATHRLIVQDDVLLCRNFLAAVERAVASRPENLLCFFHAPDPRENLWIIHAAMNEGSAWADISTGRWIPVLALAWPVELAACLLEYVDSQDWPAEFIADDEIVGRFAHACEVQVFTSCPSLVDHTDAPSVKLRHQVADEGRRAAYYIGDGDPLAIEW